MVPIAAIRKFPKLFHEDRRRSKDYCLVDLDYFNIIELDIHFYRQIANYFRVHFTAVRGNFPGRLVTA